MDYSKYDKYLCFYKGTTKLDLDFGTAVEQVMERVHEALGRVIFAKAQEYNVKEQEVQSCVIKVPWHPVIKYCTHVEIRDFYGVDIYSIELQQMPFDGELELKCVKHTVLR